MINRDYLKMDSKSIMVKALEIFSSGNSNFVDCILCATTKVTKHTVSTFDKGLKKCLDHK